MFCNKCGKQVEESKQYCGNCGESIKLDTLPMQVVETSFNFCRNCGGVVEGRYCEACGANSIKTEAKMKSGFMRMEQLKQTGTAVKNVLPTKETFKDIKLEKLGVTKATSTEIIKWVKQGLIFAIIVAVIGIGVSAFIGLGVKDTISREFFYSYRSGSRVEHNIMDTLLNLKLIIYNLFFGGKMSMSIATTGMKETIGIAMPTLGLIFGVLIMIIGEKIRVKATGQERTLIGNGVMAVVTGGVMTLAGLLLNKSIQFDMRELYGSYGSSSPMDGIKLSSNISMVFTFFVIFAMTYVTLQIVMKNKLGHSSTQAMLATVRRITFTITGFSFVMALSVIAKIFIEAEKLPEGSEWIVFLIVLIYLAGFFLMILVTGQYSMLEVVTNSEPIMKLKMTLTNVKYDMYGMEDKMDNFMKWWLIVAVIISVCIILSAAYRYFKEREVECKVAIKESVVMSIALGVGLGLIAKIGSCLVSFNVYVSSRHSNNYYRNMNNGEYEFIIKSGDSAIIKNAVIIAVIMCVLFVVMYWLVSSKMPIVDSSMKVLNAGVIWGAIAVFSIVFLIKFDTYDVNYSVIGVVDEAMEYITDEIEDNFMDIFNYYY